MCIKELLPINKRTMEHFNAAFDGPQLQPVVEFQVRGPKSTVNWSICWKLVVMQLLWYKYLPESVISTFLIFRVLCIDVTSAVGENFE